MNQGGMREQPPPPTGENFEKCMQVEKMWIRLTYCVTSGAGSRNRWFWKLSFLSQKNLIVGSFLVLSN